MELLQDGLIAFFSAVGVTCCVWLLAGAVLGAGKCRNPAIQLVLPVKGDAPAMEQDLRDLLRIRRQLPGAVIVLEDQGLSPEGRELADCFSRRYGNAILFLERKSMQKEL